ncbi:MAG: Na+/H+ antiporter NhaA [Polyangiaceae bacterium]
MAFSFSLPRQQLWLGQFAVGELRPPLAHCSASGVGPFAFERSLEWVVNDGLAVIFFFFVGMEDPTWGLRGLSEWRRAALPAAAALGGMSPALLYLAHGRAPRRGQWGVPMATDIAFAVGILTLLGKRVPPALRVLLLALAVIDDLGAIVVIAIFYSSGLSVTNTSSPALDSPGIFVMQRMSVRAKLAYVAPSLVAWAGVYAAGIHPTIAGVIVGLVTPVRAWLGPDGFVHGVRVELEALGSVSTTALSSHEFAATLGHIDVARREAMSPAELDQGFTRGSRSASCRSLRSPTRGVSLSGLSLDAPSWSVARGALAGLLVGKPVGCSRWAGSRSTPSSRDASRRSRCTSPHRPRGGGRYWVHDGDLHRAARVLRRELARRWQAGGPRGERRRSRGRARAGSRTPPSDRA